MMGTVRKLSHMKDLLIKVRFEYFYKLFKSKFTIFFSNMTLYPHISHHWESHIKQHSPGLKVYQQKSSQPSECVTVKVHMIHTHVNKV